MVLTAPPKNWKSIKIGRDEKIWVLLIAFMIVMMGGMTVGYLFVGDQNVPEAYRQVPVEDYMAEAIAGNDAAGVTDVTINNETGISLLTGGHLYMVAKQWNWLAPTTGQEAHGIQIKKGETYFLHLGSIDVLHGFQLIGSNFIITLQIVPGYDYILDFIPNETGTFRIICNEFCGAQHAQMMGFMQVVD